MKLHKADLDEIEADRQELLQELLSEEGADSLRAFKPGSFGCHELLDRTSMLAGLVEEEIQSHPACVQNAEWYAMAEKAVTALNDLYQKIGAEHLAAAEPRTPVKPSVARKPKRKAQ